MKMFLFQMVVKPFSSKPLFIGYQSSVFAGLWFINGVSVFCYNSGLDFEMEEYKLGYTWELAKIMKLFGSFLQEQDE